MTAPLAEVPLFVEIHRNPKDGQHALSKLMLPKLSPPVNSPPSNPPTRKGILLETSVRTLPPLSAREPPLLLMVAKPPSTPLNPDSAGLLVSNLKHP